MDIYKAIRTRRSVRVFKDDMVSRDVLDKIFEAVRMAPSAHNAQDYKFIIVRKGEKKRALARAAKQRFVAEAPVIIAAVSLNPGDIMSSGVPAYAFDLGIALDHLTLAAAEEGLGTCYIGSFSQEEAKKILEVPEEYTIAMLMTVGYPYDDPAPKSRKKINELVCEEKFSLK